MHFDQSVWDDSDPEYAPCLKEIRPGKFYWVTPPRYRKAGYSIKTYPIKHETHEERAAQARELTREMLRWFEGVTNGKRPGTWAWLLGRYINDEDSGFWDVQPSTREQYRKQLAKIEAGVGDVLINDTNHAMMRSWERGMRANGRSNYYIKNFFTYWGLVNTHGILIEVPRCSELAAIRSKMRIKGGTKRTVYTTREQVETIVAEADERGWSQVSLSVLFRFEYMLRGVDVYGKWEPKEGRAGGIQNKGRMWVNGLQWDMFSPDLTQFTKVISKTADSLPEPYTFDVIPEIRQRLLAIPEEKRVGPVIVMHDGLPPKHSIITKNFKKIVRFLEMPEDLQIRDNRAGGITEAKSVADPFMLRDAAQHTQVSTTDRYVRGRSEAANKVVQMRRKK